MNVEQAFSQINVGIVDTSQNQSLFYPIDYRVRVTISTNTGLDTYLEAGFIR